jgi:PilZ domain
MKTMLLRSYRKNLSTHGLLYFAGIEQAITIINLSISGILAQLSGEADGHDVNAIFKALSGSSMVDLYLPEMRMAGEAQLIRVDMQGDSILVALEFKNISHDIGSVLNKRKAYRKNLPGPGQLLLDGKYLEFSSVNVSVEGMLIRIGQPVVVEPKYITAFTFDQLGLEGQVEVVWVEYLGVEGVLMGLQFVHMEKSSIKGIPVFNLPLTA